MKRINEVEIRCRMNICKKRRKWFCLKFSCDVERQLMVSSNKELKLCILGEGGVGKSCLVFHLFS